MDISNKEMWAEVPGFDGKYFINREGQVYSINVNRLLAPDKTDKGYLKVRLYKGNTPNRVRLHRLVAMAFIPNPENKPHVNHKNMIKHDNRVENLEWCTPEENNQHALENGALHKGCPRKPIMMISVETNETKTFNSINDATRYLYPEVKTKYRLSKCGEKIRKVLRGDRNKHKGYTFKYIE